MIFLYMVKNMLKILIKTLFSCLLTINFCFSFVNAQETVPVDPPKPQMSIKIDMKDGICRSSSPIMLDVFFVNDSTRPEKFCVYNLYDSLLKLDIVDSFGKSIKFNPNLIQAGRLSNQDWVLIPPKRAARRSFSLNRKVYKETGQKLQPGNYLLKVTYTGCSKFDPYLPEMNLKSNSLHFMVTE